MGSFASDFNIFFTYKVTGKKNNNGSSGEFLPGEFRNGEYEAAVALEKQEDLKALPANSVYLGTLPANSVYLGEEQRKSEKLREAEVRTSHEIH